MKCHSEPGEESAPRGERILRRPELLRMTDRAMPRNTNLPNVPFVGVAGVGGRVDVHQRFESSVGRASYISPRMGTFSEIWRTIC